jgi:hypothetical protein
MSSSADDGPVAAGSFGPLGGVGAGAAGYDPRPGPLLAEAGKTGPVGGFMLTALGSGSGALLVSTGAAVGIAGSGIVGGGGALNVGAAGGIGSTAGAGAGVGKLTGTTGGAGAGVIWAGVAAVTGAGAGIAVVIDTGWPGVGRGIDDSTSVITYCGPFGPWTISRVGVPPAVGVADTMGAGIVAIVAVGWAGIAGAIITVGGMAGTVTGECGSAIGAVWTTGSGWTGIATGPAAE